MVEEETPVDFNALVSLVVSDLCTEEAMRMKLLRESIDNEPPEPRLDGELPADDEFYEGDGRLEWTPDDTGGDAEHRM